MEYPGQEKFGSQKEKMNREKKLPEKALIKKLNTMSREELTKIMVDLFSVHLLGKTSRSEDNMDERIVRLDEKMVGVNSVWV